jgi:hypothetical protein
VNTLLFRRLQPRPSSVRSEPAHGLVNINDLTGCCRNEIGLNFRRDTAIERTSNDVVSRVKRPHFANRRNVRGNDAPGKLDSRVLVRLRFKNENGGKMFFFFFL